MYTFRFENYAQFSRLDMVENLLSEEIKNWDQKENSFKKIQDMNLSTIFKLSERDSHFSELCKAKELDDFWIETWKAYGIYISAEKIKPIYFHDHKNTCHFTLVKGAFFYHQSQLNRKHLKIDFGYSEKSFLLKAIECGSIHVLYTTINDSKEIDIPQLFQEIIKNCKSVINTYASYAYLMLCEAYIRYGEWSFNLDNRQKAQNAYNAAIKCCEFAEKYVEKSSGSIHNAGLGEGLASSNSHNISDPSEVKTWITKFLLPKLQGDKESETQINKSESIP